MAKRKLVEVVWMDAAFHKGWYEDSHTVAPSQSRTVGYLVYSGDDHVVVAMNSEDAGSYSDAMAIPRGMVKSMERVRRK